MPFDEGTGSRRITQARKRAGVSTPKPKKKKSTYTVRADTGADKSRVAVQGRARAIVDKIQEDKSTVRTKGGIVRQDSTNIARQRLAAIQALALSDAEKRDLGSYSKAISERRQDQLNPWTKTDKVIGAVTGAYPSEFGASVRHPIDKATMGPEAKRRAIALGVLKPSETFKGALEPAGWAEGGMMAFPGFGPIGRIPARIANLADREALRALEKADDPMETLAKRYNKAAKAEDDEQMAVFKAAADKVRAHTARREAGKRPNSFDKKVAAQEKKAASKPISLTRGMGSIEYTEWGKTGTKIPPGTRFLAKTDDDYDTLADMRNFTVNPEDVREVSPGVFETVNELKMGGVGNLRPVVRGIGPTRRGEKIITAANVPRAIKSSFDVSAPFRQGIVLGGANAKLWKESWGPMMKALRENTGEAERITREIHDDPLYELAKDRVAFTELKGPMAKQEENLLGLDYASKIPVVGKGVEASSRAYNTFLNKLRMDFFRFYVEAAMEKGYDLSGTTDESKYLLDSIGKWVNTASGRGGKVDAGETLAALNATFFSPRLIMSRLQLLNPAQYVPIPGYKGPHKFVRQQARKAMGKLAAEISATLVLAQQAGADVEWDPRSSDFGKIKLGDTRIDIAGGLAQFITLYARVATRQTKTGSGEIVDLGGGFAGRDPWDVVTDFLENKAAPVPGTAINYLKGESAPGVPWSWTGGGNPLKSDITKLFLPIGLENTLDAGDPKAAAATIGLGSVGFGVDTYPTLSKKTPRTATARMEAKVKREQRKVATKAKKNGWDLPPKLNAAIEFKVKVDARIKALEAEQRNKISDEQKERNKAEGTRFKLSDKQRGAALITALRDYAPGFNYEAAKAYLDGSDPDKIDSYITSLRRYYFKDLEGWGVG